MDTNAEAVVHTALTTDGVDHLAVIVLAVRLALAVGLWAGLGYDMATGEHFVAIDLPAGQVNWSLVSEDATALFAGVPLYPRPRAIQNSQQRQERLLAPPFSEEKA